MNAGPSVFLKCDCRYNSLRDNLLRTAACMLRWLLLVGATGHDGGHMYRGGSFKSGLEDFWPAFHARPAFRLSHEAWQTTSDKGFRVARTLD